MGKASWYSEKDRGIKKRTANGEVFDDSQMTAAMWNVPLGKKIKITNQENGKSVVVRINDRGPAKKYYQQGRIIDLSKKAFSQIASTKHGIIEVDLDFIN